MYHCHIAPEPKVPSGILNVDDPPEQISVGFAEAEVGGMEEVFKLTVVFTQVVVLQSPSARIKYIVVIIGETVIEVPLPAEVPPHETVYHCHVAPVPKVPSGIVNVDEAPEQILPGFADAEVGGMEEVFKLTVVFTQVVVLQSP